MPAPKEYNGGITREQFLFFEMRIIAKYKTQGFSNDEIIELALNDNILEMKTEKSIKLIASACIRRLDNCDERVAELIATGTPDVAKQANLYAMMKHNRIVWDFMIQVIGHKYETQDLTFGKKDVNQFFTVLKEQNEDIASWTENTFAKIRSVLIRILADTDYLDDIRSETLNPVYLYDELEQIMLQNNDEVAFHAFNRFM